MIAKKALLLIKLYQYVQILETLISKNLGMSK